MMCNLTTSIEGASVNTTIYVGRHFEVRDHDQPTKFVFSGATRVAEITGSLSTNLRIQRLRLHEGWNLCTLAVSGPFPTNAVNAISAAYQWNPQTNGYSPVVLEQTLPANEVIWLMARTTAIVSIVGSYLDPGPQQVESGGTYLSGSGLEAWAPTLPDSTSSWQFDATSAQWHEHLGGSLAGIEDPQPVLSPGEAVYLESPVPISLQMPDAALRIRYYHQDHLGSSGVVSDSAGQIIQETAFYPYGCEREEYQPRQIQEPYQFAQKERDRETRLHYFEARLLDAPLARFSSADQKCLNVDSLSPKEMIGFLRNPQLMNAYGYGADDPVRLADPSGLGPMEVVKEAFDRYQKEQEPLGPYKTQDEAATAALIAANPKSISENREYGGLVYYNPTLKRYYATAPSTGKEASFDPSGVNVPAGTTKVGDYHTHADYSSDFLTPFGAIPIHPVPKSMDKYDSDHFSGQDKTGISADAVGIAGYKGYLATPSANQGSLYARSGDFQQFDPATSSVSVLRQVRPVIAPPVCTVSLGDSIFSPLALSCR